MVDQAHARNAAAVSRLEPGNTTPVCDEDGSACSAYSPARPRADDPSGSGARGMEVGGAQRPCSASCLAIPLWQSSEAQKCAKSFGRPSSFFVIQHSLRQILVVTNPILPTFEISPKLGTELVAAAHKLS